MYIAGMENFQIHIVALFINLYIRSTDNLDQDHKILYFEELIWEFIERSAKNNLRNTPN